MDKPTLTINGIDYSDLFLADSDTKTDSLDGYGGSDEFVNDAKERTEILKNLRTNPTAQSTPEA